MATQPSRAFEITAKSGTLLLDERGAGRADFTVTNATDTPRRFRAVVEPLEAAKPEWFTITDRVERTLGPGTTTHFTVVTRVPLGTTPRTYQFRLDVTSGDERGMRDTIYVRGPAVGFEVRPSLPVPPPPNWWQRNWRWLVPVASVAVLLLVSGIVVAQVRSRQAAEAERQRVAAIEAEEQRLAEEKRLAVKAEQKRLADEAEKKRLADADRKPKKPADIETWPPGERESHLPPLPR